MTFRFKIGDLVVHKTNTKITWVIRNRGDIKIGTPGYHLKRVDDSGKYQSIIVPESDVEKLEIKNDSSS